MADAQPEPTLTLDEAMTYIRIHGPLRQYTVLERLLAPVFARAKQAEVVVPLAQRFVDYETLETVDYARKYGLGFNPWRMRPQRKIIVDLICAALDAGAEAQQPTTKE